MKCLILFFTGIVTSQCLPNIGIGTLGTDKLDALTGLAGEKIDLKVDGKGLEIEQHHTDVEKTSEFGQNSSQIQRHGSNFNETSSNDSSHTSQDVKETERDQGISLGSGGLSIFDEKTVSEDKITEDKESRNSSRVEKDATPTSQHKKSYNNTYDKSVKTHDHREDHERRGISLGGGGIGINKEESKHDRHEVEKREDYEEETEEEDTHKTENGKKKTVSRQKTETNDESDDVTEHSRQNNDTYSLPNDTKVEVFHPENFYPKVGPPIYHQISRALRSADGKTEVKRFKPQEEFQSSFSRSYIETLMQTLLANQANIQTNRLTNKHSPDRYKVKANPRPVITNLNKNPDLVNKVKFLRDRGDSGDQSHPQKSYGYFRDFSYENRGTEFENREDGIENIGPVNERSGSVRNDDQGSASIADNDRNGNHYESSESYIVAPSSEIISASHRTRKLEPYDQKNTEDLDKEIKSKAADKILKSIKNKKGFIDTIEMVLKKQGKLTKNDETITEAYTQSDKSNKVFQNDNDNNSSDKTNNGISKNNEHNNFYDRLNDKPFGFSNINNNGTNSAKNVAPTENSSSENATVEYMVEPMDLFDDYENEEFNSNSFSENVKNGTKTNSNHKKTKEENQAAESNEIINYSTMVEKIKPLISKNIMRITNLYDSVRSDLPEPITKIVADHERIKGDTKIAESDNNERIRKNSPATSEEVIDTDNTKNTLVNYKHNTIRDDNIKNDLDKFVLTLNSDSNLNKRVKTPEVDRVNETETQNHKLEDRTTKDRRNTDFTKLLLATTKNPQPETFYYKNKNIQVPILTTFTVKPLTKTTSFNFSPLIIQKIHEPVTLETIPVKEFEFTTTTKSIKKTRKRTKNFKSTTERNKKRLIDEDFKSITKSHKFLKDIEIKDIDNTPAQKPALLASAFHYEDKNRSKIDNNLRNYRFESEHDSKTIDPLYYQSLKNTHEANDSLIAKTVDKRDSKMTNSTADIYKQTDHKMTESSLPEIGTTKATTAMIKDNFLNKTTKNIKAYFKRRLHKRIKSKTKNSNSNNTTFEETNIKQRNETVFNDTEFRSQVFIPKLDLDLNKKPSQILKKSRDINDTTERNKINESKISEKVPESLTFGENYKSTTTKEIFTKIIYQDIFSKLMFQDNGTKLESFNKTTNVEKDPTKDGQSELKERFKENVVKQNTSSISFEMENYTMPTNGEATESYSENDRKTKLSTMINIDANTTPEQQSNITSENPFQSHGNQNESLSFERKKDSNIQTHSKDGVIQDHLNETTHVSSIIHEIEVNKSITEKDKSHVKNESNVKNNNNNDSTCEAKYDEKSHKTQKDNAKTRENNIKYNKYDINDKEDSKRSSETHSFTQDDISVNKKYDDMQTDLQDNDKIILKYVKNDSYWDHDIVDDDNLEHNPKSIDKYYKKEHKTSHKDSYKDNGIVNYYDKKDKESNQNNSHENSIKLNYTVSHDIEKSSTNTNETCRAKDSNKENDKTSLYYENIDTKLNKNSYDEINFEESNKHHSDQKSDSITDDETSEMNDDDESDNKNSNSHDKNNPENKYEHTETEREKNRSKTKLDSHKKSNERKIINSAYKKTKQKTKVIRLSPKHRNEKHVDPHSSHETESFFEDSHKRNDKIPLGGERKEVINNRQNLDLIYLNFHKKDEAQSMYNQNNPRLNEETNAETHKSIDKIEAIFKKENYLKTDLIGTRKKDTKFDVYVYNNPKNNNEKSNDSNKKIFHNIDKIKVIPNEDILREIENKTKIIQDLGSIIVELEHTDNKLLSKREKNDSNLIFTKQLESNATELNTPGKDNSTATKIEEKKDLISGKQDLLTKIDKVEDKESSHEDSHENNDKKSHSREKYHKTDKETYSKASIENNDTNWKKTIHEIIQKEPKYNNDREEKNVFNSNDETHFTTSFDKTATEINESKGKRSQRQLNFNYDYEIEEEGEEIKHESKYNNTEHTTDTSQSISHEHYVTKVPESQNKKYVFITERNNTKYVIKDAVKTRIKNTQEKTGISQSTNHKHYITKVQDGRNNKYDVINLKNTTKNIRKDAVKIRIKNERKCNREHENNVKGDRMKNNRKHLKDMKLPKHYFIKNKDRKNTTKEDTNYESVELEIIKLEIDQNKTKANNKEQIEPKIVKEYKRTADESNPKARIESKNKNHNSDFEKDNINKDIVQNGTEETEFGTHSNEMKTLLSLLSLENNDKSLKSKEKGDESDYEMKDNLNKDTDQNGTKKTEFETQTLNPNESNYKIDKIKNKRVESDYENDYININNDHKRTKETEHRIENLESNDGNYKRIKSKEKVDDSTEEKHIKSERGPSHDSFEDVQETYYKKNKDNYYY